MIRFAFTVLLIALAIPASAADLLVEAESFDKAGGWSLDTQFIQQMGSPYLLAHGLGRPVEDATTTVDFPEAGSYRVFVRTLDWVARWKAPGDPGRFRVLVNGKELQPTFGTDGADWAWHDGGSVEIKDREQVTIALRDLTGFDGRCDALYFTTSKDSTPPNDPQALSDWRKDTLGLPREPETKTYDLVVVGGGYSGMGAAISAARMGCKVALIQDRGVLGGNGSSEVRVWAMGLIRRGKFPRIGEIVEEFADKATASPGLAEEFGDALKEKTVRAEKNIDLYLNNHADKVHVENGQIVAVEAFDTRTSRRTRFEGRLFADCTGHGTIGYLAGAEWDMTPEGRMGMSNMWRWENEEAPQSFPETPWALDLTMKDFPYPKRNHAEWFWESGFDQDPIAEAEAIRDWNLRAAYGAFNAMKNRDGAAAHKNAKLVWLAYVGGTRESRRLMGDVVLTQDDIVSKRDFPDGCVPSTWSIDLHYPKDEYAKKFPENPFISIAEHDRRIDREYGYPIPYRCFYSKNIPNLFMAGRCISVTHEALGTTRVMKTCGMMGEVVGKAAAICVEQNCTPRKVYESYLDELLTMLELPGKARRETIGGETVIPPDALPLAGSHGPPTGIDPAKLEGVVVDDRAAKQTGSWSEGDGLKGYVGYGYRYAGAGTDGTITFALKAPEAGRYELRYATQPHENRASNAVATIKAGKTQKEVSLNLKEKPPIEGGWLSLGEYSLAKDAEVTVALSAKKANGFIHADAVWLVPSK